MDKMFTRILWGGLARFMNVFIPVQKKHWIFGSDFGHTYREGSKYLLEYMLSNYPNYTCTFITDNIEVKKDLNEKGVPCLMNNSLSGIVAIAKADVVVTAQYLNDIRFVFKKKNRSFYYLLHGQPYKNGICTKTDRTETILSSKRKISKYFFPFLMKCFVYDYNLSDVSFMSTTSEFLKPWEEQTVGNSVPIKLLGSPRNDALFDSERMKKEKWINGIDGKTVITYMPTHRLYGIGDLSPVPFEHNSKVQDWLRKNNAVLIMKQHPNMISKLKNPINTDVIKDITKMAIDPQVVIYHTDVLITDYSSVFIDFLLFQRPLLFYIYDDYEDIEGCLYDIHPDFPKSFCYNEEDLFMRIKDSIYNKVMMSPSKEVIRKYHKYIDDKSCQRYYEAIVADKKYYG